MMVWGSDKGDGAVGVGVGARRMVSAGGGPSG